MIPCQDNEDSFLQAKGKKHLINAMKVAMTTTLDWNILFVQGGFQLCQELGVIICVRTSRKNWSDVIFSHNKQRGRDWNKPYLFSTLKSE